MDDNGRAMASEADREPKKASRAAWARGNYHEFAKATVWELGEVLVRACDIIPLDRKLEA